MISTPIVGNAPAIESPLRHAIVAATTGRQNLATIAVSTAAFVACAIPAARGSDRSRGCTESGVAHNELSCASRLDDIDAVLSKGGITRGDRVALVERVRDEQPIEGVTVVPWQGADPQRRCKPDIDDVNSGTSQLSREPQLGGRFELELSERLLDRNLPRHDDAHGDFVGAVFQYSARVGLQSVGISDGPQENMRVDEHLHDGSSPKAAAMSGGSWSKSG